MYKKLTTLFEAERNAVYLLFRKYLEMNQPYLLRSSLVETFDEFCAAEAGQVLKGTVLEDILHHAEEAAILSPVIYLCARMEIGEWSFFSIHAEQVVCEEVDATEFLKFKEHMVEPEQRPDDWVLELDLSSFDRGFPVLHETRSIGKGVEFLNRHLSRRMFDEVSAGGEKLLTFLRMHHWEDRPLMLNQRIISLRELRRALKAAERYLRAVPRDAEWEQIGSELCELGFEPGWGRTAASIRDMMHLLSDILEAPEPRNLAEFLGRIPMIFHTVILSPHGYFGQAGVLGLPDTGGQVVYILDQVRAVEKEMRANLHEQGLDIEPQILVVTRLIPEAGQTTCNQRIEHIFGTENARILRVPFRRRDGSIVSHWISRFEVWPYLEQFAIDAEKEVMTELGDRPDLIIGNYSDGNLVATLMARRLHVTQCNIAHALEKTKYLFSALYWKEQDPHYHFSCQFTADLIAMNTADFIITSTYQEIAGTDESAGQYESYGSFTMPGLYRVIKGVDIFDPKFNIVSPGADADIYFPYTESDRRVTELHGELQDMVFGAPGDDRRGCLADSGKPLLFAMSRLDHIKNITGLAQWYAESEVLRAQANLFIVAGTIHPDQSTDNEERDQIHLLHDIMSRCELDASVRWVGKRLDKVMSGELYRYVADQRGIFVQPARFEAFGLTVIEAMSSGLPTFATLHGGPLEIIEDGISGFHIDPNHGDQAAIRMADFFARVQRQPEEWDEISRNALRRVEEKYTWKRYAQRLLRLARIYGFWKHMATNIEREETRQHIDMFYGLLFRSRAAVLTE